MGARIGVIGAGQVGAAAAYLLSGTAGVSDVVLVDVNTARAAGEAADIGHAAAFGIVMIQSFVVSFGFILPTNAPQNMLCYATGAIRTKEFAKIGVVVTVAGLLLIMLLSATVWPMMGVL